MFIILKDEIGIPIKLLGKHPVESHKSFANSYVIVEGILKLIFSE